MYLISTHLHGQKLYIVISKALSFHLCFLDGFQEL